jgi:hypothetical protein
MADFTPLVHEEYQIACCRVITTSSNPQENNKEERCAMTSQRIAIVTDSSAYIPDEARKGLNISIIPLWLIWDGKTYQDGIDIQPAVFYQRL